MKFSTTIVALASIAAHAAAVEQFDSSALKSGTGFAYTPGQKGFEAKHIAKAIASAIRQPEVDPKNHGLSAFCGVSGSSGCNEKWSHVAKIGAAAEKVHAQVYAREALAAAEADPRGKIHYCGVPGEACMRKRDPRGKIHYCGVPGEACMKRDAEADPRGKIHYCGVPGEACMRKREDALATAPDAYWPEDYEEVPGSAINEKRAAEAEALGKKPKLTGGRINYCGVPGSACMARREAEPRGKIHYCGVPGAACMKTRDAEADPRGKIHYCGVPGEACMKKRSDIEEYQNAIRKFNPNIEKHECFQEGQPCDLITKAAHTLKTAKAPTTGPLSAAALAHLKSAGSAEAKKAEAECHGPHGACTLAARDVEELETAINEAVAEVYDL
ncbi:hypothetical protein LTR53_003626 [Teratosphaeriaceae sp. CCFEE 6253]|nr:hypothetical protein LTR53_003626 [Teratosphaeriaceae sp. CCFEE 6253]